MSNYVLLFGNQENLVRTITRAFKTVFSDFPENGAISGPIEMQYTKMTYTTLDFSVLATDNVNETGKRQMKTSF